MPPRPISPFAERPLLGALAALLFAAGAAPSVVVSRDGNHLDVEARAAPIADVLDAITAQLGIAVEYEGTPPRDPVTLTLRGRTPAEAVLSVLDGQDVDYALQLDASGTGVTRLLIQSAASAPPRARPTPARRPPPAPTPPPVPEFSEPFDPAAKLDEGDPDAEPEEVDPDAPEPPPERPPAAVRPGRPSPAPLLFPSPLNPATPTPTPPPQP
jgi:hypothetical protein